MANEQELHRVSFFCGYMYPVVEERWCGETRGFHLHRDVGVCRHTQLRALSFGLSSCQEIVSQFTEVILYVWLLVLVDW